MLRTVTRKIFGSRNDRIIKRLSRTVQQINALEESTAALSDAELAARTVEFRERVQGGATLDELLPEAFAVVREAGKRVLEMRHFDVQLIGGMVLHEGRISEMRTGEGKTLVATLPVFLNALAGKGVHVVTVNDYLAQRDAAWMGKLYGFLGLSVGVIVAGLNHDQRRQAYAADVTYGTNNEFGFDYLRDNMAFRSIERVQRGLNYAIVDEVDSILIDEARTPLIISGPTADNSELYHQMDKVIPQLTRQQSEDGEGDYSVDEKNKSVYLTEAGHEHVEALLVKQGLLGENDSLYDTAHISLLHHLNSALRAHALFHKDVEYIVANDQIVIVDEFTGRTMPGRRWSEGLHQAIEAKEGVTVQNENQTLASITFQNYFRLYDKLAGMTGTADTEAFEFQSIYGLEVVVVPTHMPMVREDLPDLVFLTQKEKFDAIVEDIADCVKQRQPVLVGTTSIETSEYLSGLLQQQKIPHEVLNAKQHEREAHIIEQAGRPGAVTIATNMAGRGTDIVLGGSLEAQLAVLGEDEQDKAAEVRQAWKALHDDVVGAGGLHIVGTERHESRRIDNQLRGRSGRQGDPGSSRFYLSLEDNLMRIFASERVASLMQKLGMEEGEAIEHTWVTKAIENAQRKVEAHNFDIRKNLLEYDDVANDQRKVIYEQRNELMAADDVSETVAQIRADVCNEVIDQHIAPGSLDEEWDVAGLADALEHEFGERMDIQGWLDADDSLHEETLREKILGVLEEKYAEKERQHGAELMRNVEKWVLLQVLDRAWKEHLAAMDYLRQSVGLRGYAQKNPKQEYKRESFEMFTGMLQEMKREVAGVLAKLQIQGERDAEVVQEPKPRPAAMQFQHAAADSALRSEPAPASQEGHTPFVRKQPKIGRNEPCFCGSGKKFKHCHGRLNQQ